LVVSAQALEAADAAIDAIDHFPLTLEATRGSDFVAVSQYRSGRLLQSERSFQLRMADLTAAMAKSFGEDLMIEGDGDSLEHVILGVSQRVLG
jgi:hypothetical protein